MALYHFHVTQIKRSRGQSVMACAAYRAGEKLYSERYGGTSDYTRKGGVICSEILLPANAPPEFADRQTLWNSLEAAEKNKNAQLAYSFDIALQNEFSLDENIALARHFLLENFVSRGMIADFAVHEADKEDGGIPKPHFHVLCPIRPLNPDGSWGDKQHRVYRLDEDGNRITDENGKELFDAVPTTDWGRPETLDHWRQAWANLCNQKFEEKGLADRIDHRSYEAQGIALLPQVHEGPAVRQMEAKGIRTNKGDLNRWIKTTNAMIRSLAGKVKNLMEWVKEIRSELAVREPESPLLEALLLEYSASERERSRTYSQKWQRDHSIETMKEVAEARIFLNEEGLKTLDDLNSTLSALRETITDTKSAVSSGQRRMQQLQKLIEAAETFRKYQPIHDESKRLEHGFKNRKEKYDREHEAELIKWKAANRFLHANVTDMKAIPVKQWRAEYAGLAAEVNDLSASLSAPKAELHEMDKIRKMIDRVLKEQAHEQEIAEQKDKKPEQNI